MLPTSAPLTAGQLRDLLDRYLQTSPRRAEEKVVIAYDPGHATIGGRYKLAVTGLGGGIDWDQGNLFLHTEAPVGIVPAELRKKLSRYENFLGHISMHLRRAQEKGVAPDATILESFIQRLRDGNFEDTLPHWDPEAVVTEAQLAHDLAIGVPAVRRREKAKQLIVFPDPATGEKFYPAYQSWAAVQGKPLARLLAFLFSREDQAWATPLEQATFAHTWLITPNAALAQRLPLEVLVGEAFAGSDPTPEARELLEQAHPTRVDRVLQAVSAG